MTAADVPDVLDIQEPGAVLGLADVFPQDAYPFPRDVVAQRWRQEIATPGVDCYVVVLDGTVEGFAAIRDDSSSTSGPPSSTGAQGSPRPRTMPCST